MDERSASAKAGFLFLVIATVVHFTKALDFKLQHLFYQVSGSVDWNQERLHFFFYDVSRKAPWIVALLVLPFLVFRLFRKKPVKEILRVMAFLGIVPGVTNFLKYATAQACPNAFLSFSGTLNDRAVFVEGARCFPGGHASAGFALLGLCYIVQNEKKRRLLFIALSVWGFILAFYQVARGVHFISDGFATYGISLLFYSLLHPSRFSIKERSLST